MARPVLIIQLAKLGDFIQSTLLLAKVRAAFPDSPIFMATAEKSVEAAAKLSPLVDETLCAAPEERPWEIADRLKALGPLEALVVLNSHRRAAALARDLKTDAYFGPRLDSSDRLIFSPGQRLLMALMAHSRRLARFNLVDLWASLLPGPFHGSLSWPQGPEPSRPSEALVGLQLGCRSRLRRWPAEDFAEFCLKTAAGCPGRLRFRLLGSREERPLGARLKELLAGQLELEDLMGETDLELLGRKVAELNFLVSADTGVMHLAAAVGRPVLAVFGGPAYAPETGPYGPGHLICQALAPCAPCREGAGCRQRRCLKLPEPAQAAQAALHLLSGAEAKAYSPSPLPAGQLIWASETDDFGQVLRPLGRPLLDSTEALALLVSEAGRAQLADWYRPSPAALAAVLSAYERGPEEIIFSRALLNSLAQSSFAGRPAAAERWLGDLDFLAGHFGFKIA